ncbi:cupin domain-containing protein [Allostreptomyces psammosilenae]|uniref:Mannose-6-phosphate isomerase-like protein (Cupin superfamily) n=1 Tax=Allostreptomyces psammosilenae TaxID=1892865 RepID=A0A852ZXM7_9ACTN|nr:cupin domain-containing protein [Allostreptomyces psammosilenae]NYI06785.1 mannose-6-phosphate isomerase-like protein (cupin superfamily) [Allostreptomyces psammosilenae]
MTLIGSGGTEPVLVRADDAEVLAVGGNTLRLLADGGPGGAPSAIRSTMASNTDGPAPHYHDHAPEIFFIIEGGLHVLVGERVVTAREGDYLLVPPGTTHTFRTPADTGVDMLFLMPGAERFEYFRLAERISRGLADPREVLDSQDLFDNHFVDSAPWHDFRSAAGASAQQRPGGGRQP